MEKGRSFKIMEINWQIMLPEKPKLVIISRGKSRRMMNQKEIVKLAEKIGFEVEILNPKRNTEMVEMFRALNSCDVMVGVHGAAMTHLLFMIPGSVFIQIVPFGTDWASATYYGEPGTKLGLTYIEYKILPEESSLFAEYGRNDPVLRDPDSVNRKGWGETKRVYLEGQNVNPSLKRFNKTLLSAYSIDR
ncbi:xylan glycosyltransferase MUCI21-like [Cryptomeria japonica]|uniref:xylan glycosyltransferase MUCI21-like n=1 Tax=Cryptomeria japonica TaxID=3369 RepID=UPI0027DA554D|nr:xylan glycosyltransferase MUCI21-like [Cryptomeria japonica]